MALRQRKGDPLGSPKNQIKTIEPPVLPGKTLSTSLIASNSEHIHGSFLEKYERFIPWVLLAICAFTRFWRLDKPNGEAASNVVQNNSETGG